MANSFIIIDENELDCFIAKKIIGYTGDDNMVKAFINPEIAFGHIRLDTTGLPGEKSIILLDLRMPFMDGFEFLDKFDVLPPATRKKFSICVLSSTRNSSDLLRLKQYASVKCVLEKPLTKDKFKFLLGILDVVN